MVYVRKICPICGKEFSVLECVAEKAVYCTLECLTKAQEVPGVQERVLVVVQ